MDVNVIVMDWRRLALSDYATAARGVPDVGRGLGQFINFLINTAGGNLNNVHLVGFSLGAHLVGNAGRELGGRVARITGKYRIFVSQRIMLFVTRLLKSVEIGRTYNISIRFLVFRFGSLVGQLAIPLDSESKGTKSVLIMFARELESCTILYSE